MDKIIEKYSDYKKVHNPFCCKIPNVDNRYFRTDPNETKGNTSNSRVYQTEDGYFMRNEADPKLEYMVFNHKKDIADIKYKEMTSIDKFDYVIDADTLNKAREKNGKEAIHKDPLPLSFIQINNVEDGIEWYRKHNPKIPTDLLPIIARYHWGPAINKHTLKKEKKIVKKEKKKAEIKFQKGSFALNFD